MCYLVLFYIRAKFVIRFSFGYECTKSKFSALEKKVGLCKIQHHDNQKGSTGFENDTRNIIQNFLVWVNNGWSRQHVQQLK